MKYLDDPLSCTGDKDSGNVSVPHDGVDWTIMCMKANKEFWTILCCAVVNHALLIEMKTLSLF